MKQESKWREGSRQIRRHEKRGRSPASRLIESGRLSEAKHLELEAQLSTLNPFAMKKEIRRLEDRLWSRRKELYAEQSESVALAVAPSLSSGPPARAIKPATTNQAARSGSFRCARFMR